MNDELGIHYPAVASSEHLPEKVKLAWEVMQSYWKNSCSEDDGVYRAAEDCLVRYFAAPLTIIAKKDW